MTASEPDTSDISPDHPHLNQMDALLVATLCMEALRIAGQSPHVKMEVDGFKESRSAWDATRLANALFFWEPGHPETAALIERLDQEATQVAGFELPNKCRRQR